MSAGLQNDRNAEEELSEGEKNPGIDDFNDEQHDQDATVTRGKDAEVYNTDNEKKTTTTRKSRNSTLSNKKKKTNMKSKIPSNAERPKRKRVQPQRLATEQAAAMLSMKK